MINEIILKVRKYVPSYWPLQSFIATNPLFSLVDKPLDECLSDLGKYIDVKGFLGLGYYHQYYLDGKITARDLDASIQEFLSDKKQNLNYKSELFRVLTDPIVQSDLEINFDKFNKEPSILFSQQFIKNKHNTENEDIKVRVIKFLADFLDIGQAKWAMPIKHDSLYLAWREYSIVEDKYIRQSINESPADSEAAIKYLLDKLGVPQKFIEQYLIEIIFNVLGWCSIVRWLEDRPDNSYLNRKASIADVLAIWLSLEYALFIRYKLSFKIHLDLNPSCNLLIQNSLQAVISSKDILALLNRYTISLIWQRALELNYQEQLMKSLKTNLPLISTTSEFIPRAQLLFCIDTRSEGIRRKLEFIGEYGTYGFAGFFGVGFKLFDESSGGCSFQCPAIVVPGVTLVKENNTQSSLNKIQSSVVGIINKTKNGYLAPLMLFDILGAFFSLLLVGKTVFFEAFSKLFKVTTESKYSSSSLNVFQSNGGFNSEELAEKANFVLTSIGLRDKFSQFVIVSGHLAQSENNPFQSSLDCGACGGNGGIPNSIAFCQALNDHKVRAILETKYKILIPKSTFFVSASHNTTTDEFNYYNLDLMNEIQKSYFDDIANDIRKAGELLRIERLTELKGSRGVNMRKSNWAELIPEMSLANNAAFIIGPRKITTNLNLGRRTFLHSYDPSLDDNGGILNFIFNAPVLVGHWINSQYYFSTTDMDIYGAGNKAIHNVVGQFGVMEGNFSDYKIGLPMQSISYQDTLVHQPLRLLVIVYARHKIVDKILANSPMLSSIFNGRWAYLQVIEPVV